MYDIYLTETAPDSAHPHRVADVYAVEDHEDAYGICASLQPYLRGGIEAHFASEDDEPQHVRRGDAGHTAAELAHGHG